MQICHGFIAHGVLFLLIDYTQRVTQKIQIWQRNIFPDRKFRAKTVLFPVLRCQNDTRPDGICRIIDCNGLAVKDQLAGFLGIHTEDSTGSLGTSGTHQARKAHNLTGINFEVDIPNQTACVEVADFKDLLTLFTFHPGELFLDFTANHVGDDLIHGSIPEIHGIDVLTVTHNGDPIHNVLQLFQSVGNIDDSAAIFSQLPNDTEEFINFLGCQRRGRFIHDQNLGIDGKSLCNFHHLLLGNRQITNHLAGINVNSQIIQISLCFCFHGLFIHHESLHQFPAKEHIFSHRQMGAHIQLLVDDRHTKLLGLLGRQVTVLLAKDFHRAAVSGIDTAQDLHQRGFTCTVFTQQSHHLARAQFEVNIIQSFYAGKAFVDAMHRHNVFLHPLTLPSLLISEIV